MDYKDTLCLPKTNFPMKASLSRREPELLSHWEKISLYSHIQEKWKGREKYILHDGPPYANGDIHMGHALNKILKDIIVKYKTMTGYNASFVPGWDCHGLPIEHQITKSCNENLPQSEIRRQCKEFAMRYVNIQREEFKRLGIFGDWEHPYLTLSNEYCAMVLDAFMQLAKTGYVYKGVKPIYWCPSCETALAEAEVEYLERVSPSIYVKFPIIDKKNRLKDFNRLSILIWTTTPWTLPANVAISLHPKFTYGVVEIEDETLIIAEKLINRTMAETGTKEYRIVETLTGDELEGTTCAHPIQEARTSVVVLGDHVTLEQGTGCVHTAPGHGTEDYEVGIRYNLPIVAPVDERGRFTHEVPKFSGMNVFDANYEINKTLMEAGLLFHKSEITHSYPHCWRCKNPIIFRATEQWFIDLNAHMLRERVLEEVKEIEWIPSWGGTRITNMIKGRADWCISRQRTWGVPIPAFYCKDCGNHFFNLEAMEKERDLVREKGLEAWMMKDAAEFLPPRYRCEKCGGGNFIKEKDILDVWFESGASHHAVLKTRDELHYPANLYLEGSDQYRGWFQSSILLSTALSGKSPYRTVLTHGFMLDEEGQAMHKSRGNVVSPLEVVNKYGADILRLWVASTDYTSDVRFGHETITRITEAYRKIRNTIRFILGNLYDFDHQADSIPYNDLLELDKYLLHKLEELIQETRKAYEGFEFHKIFHLVYEFCSVTLSAFYLDIAKDRLYISSQRSLMRKSCQTVLWETLDNLTRIIAPILPFTSEETWQHFKPERLSIHLEDFPHLKKEFVLDDETLREWEILLEARTLAMAEIERKRKEGIIGNSLEAKIEIIADPKTFHLLKRHFDFLKLFFIVSSVTTKRNEKGLKINVERARGEKCVRCWNYDESVGKNTSHPQLCKRCLLIIETAPSSGST